MQFVRGDTLINAQNWASSQNYVLDKRHIDRLAIQVSYSNATTAAVTFTSGLIEVDQITFAAKTSTTDGDYFVIHDYLGGSWAVALDKTGGAANTPTGAAWVAVAAANKVYTDISSATTGSDVCGLVVTAIQALTGFTAVITAAASTTHMNCTDAFAGVVTTPAVYSKTGASGTGSVTFSVTTAGTASKVNPVTNTISIAGHGQVVGSVGQMTTSSALPTGLLTTTNYYVIVVDANTIKLASSLVNAVAGTAITLTSSGVGTQTFTPTTGAGNVLKAQASCDGTTWTDISGDTVTIATSSSNALWDLGTPAYGWVRLLYTPSAGTATVTAVLNGFSDK